MLKSQADFKLGRISSVLTNLILVGNIGNIKTNLKHTARADMGRHAGVRLITGNQSLTVVNLARSVGNLKKIFTKKKSREIMGKTYLISRQK